MPVRVRHGHTWQTSLLCTSRFHPYILVYWHDLCYAVSGSGNLSRVWTIENDHMNKILRAMTQSGVKVSLENVEEVQRRLFRQVWLNDEAPRHLKDALVEAN